MNQEKVYQVKPLTPSIKVEFSNIKRAQASFGRILGVNFINSKKSWKNLAWHCLAQASLIWLVGFLVVEMVLAFSHYQQNMSFILFGVLASTLNTILSQHMFIMFWNKEKIRLIFENGEKFYETSGSTIGLQVISILRYLSYFFPVTPLAYSAAMSFIKEELFFLYPTYNHDFWSDNLLWGIVLNVTYIVGTIFFCRIFFFTLTLFMIFMNYITAEYDHLTFIVQNLSKSAANRQISEDIHRIIDQHSNLIQKIKDIDKVFNIPLLASEIFCVVGIPYSGFCILFMKDLAIVAAVGIGFMVIFNQFYSVFGQKIIDAAFEFEMSLNNLNWIDFSVDERQKLMFIMRMAQKPIGISCGGFHLLGHPQMTQVS